MTETYEGVAAVGVDLGTSTSKFCAGNHVAYLTSVAGDALTDQLEDSWRRMNRSTDQRFIHNLALWDARREVWRYMGAMSRASQRTQWYTEGGVLQNLDDAYLGLQAGLFALGEASGQPLTRVAMGLGAPIKAGEAASARFVDHLKERLVDEDGKRLLKLRAKNVATGEVKEQSIEVLFSLVQFQAYGAYMVLLFSKFDMKLYNTYVIDIGHGTWITLPIADNEVDIALADSRPSSVHAITSNISQTLFEKSGQKVRVPEQRIMEKVAAGRREIEVPGAGVFNFEALLDAECDGLADEIMKKVRVDVGALGAKGVSLDYFAITGGGSHLVFDKLKGRIKEFFAWDDTMSNERIVSADALPVEPRYANAVGMMLLARDQIALDRDEDVDPTIEVSAVVTDQSS